MKMATSLNEANLEKRLLTLTNTQESIQTLSLWCLHHKSHCKKIIDIWMKVLKKVKVSHRLTLFYLANDVIQNGKRKGCGQFAEVWMPVIKHAVVLVRDEKIRPQIERILTIWNDRSIFDAQYINELHTVLGKTAASKVQAVVNAKILAEFKPQKLVDKIKKFKKLESDVEIKHKQFCSLKMDVCSSETLKQLKDKAHGTKFTKEFEDATTKLEELIHLLQREVKERSALLELLEQSEVFYETQKKEAKIVANAYKNFGTRVKNLQTKLQEVIPNLPSPVPTPTLDAPSPVDSSSGESPTKDDSKGLKMDNKTSTLGKESKNTKGAVDESKDNTEAVDMEMSDDDCDNAGKDGSADVPSPGSAPSPEGSPVGLNLSPPHVRKPHSKETLLVTKALSAVAQIPTVTKNSFSASSLFDGVTSSGTQSKASASSLDIRLSNLMQNIPNFTTNFFQGRPIEGINSIHGAGSTISGHSEGCNTPVKDEESATGSATPLQDENREANYASQPLKEGSATPTIGDILQKLVSTGSVHALNSQSNVSGQNWPLQSTQPLSQSQTWYSQSSPSQALKVKPLPPPPAPLFTNLVPTIPLPSSSRPFQDPANADNVLTTSPSYTYEPTANSSTSTLGSFPPSSVNADVGDSVSKSRNSKPGQVYRRNSNIVELTPSPGATPNFDGSHETCKNNNLITLVQNCDSENTNQSVNDGQTLPETSYSPSLKTRAVGNQPVRYAGSSSVGPSRSVMTTNLLTVSNNANNNGENQSYVAGDSGSTLVDNSSVSNLRTIVPLVPYVMDDVVDAKVEKTSSVVETGNSLTQLGAQTSYSKIETLDSRRDSASMWSSNMGNVFSAQSETMSSGWKPMVQVASAPFRRETPPYGTVRGFSFQRRGIRRDWNPASVGPPPKRLMLAPTSTRPPRWSHNPPPY